MDDVTTPLSEGSKDGPTATYTADTRPPELVFIVGDTPGGFPAGHRMSNSLIQAVKRRSQGNSHSRHLWASEQVEKLPSIPQPSDRTHTTRYFKLP